MGKLPIIQPDKTRTIWLRLTLLAICVGDNANVKSKLSLALFPTTCCYQK